MAYQNIDIHFEFNDRLDRDSLYILMAKLMGYRGTCLRANVGCIITVDNRIVSTGYNGSIHNEHCKELACDIKQKCQHAVHAEANAIAFAAKKGISLEGGTLYCNYSPCTDCAKLIIQAGIKRVVYETDYTSNMGEVILRKKGIEVKQYEAELRS